MKTFCLTWFKLCFRAIIFTEVSLWQITILGTVIPCFVPFSTPLRGLILVEHQSTVNENMPFRCLSYIAELLNNLIKNKHRLYYKGQIKFPHPKFFVLYDGDKSEPLRRIMRLSDEFDGESDLLELVVTAFNINSGLSQPLLEKCGYLAEYSALVGKVKEGIRMRLSRRDAISRAVKFCIDNGIMGDYLVKNSKEVFDMLELEWNFDDALQARFDEGYEDGRNKEREILALKLIHRGRPLDEIHEDTGLSLHRIEQLANNVPVA